MSAVATPRGVTPRGHTPRGSGPPGNRPGALSGGAVSRAFGLTPPLETLVDVPVAGSAEGITAGDQDLAPEAVQPVVGTRPGQMVSLDGQLSGAWDQNLTSTTHQTAATAVANGRGDSSVDVQAMRKMREIKMRDTVAFLLGRAPDTSFPPVKLKELEGVTPRSLLDVAPTTRAFHGDQGANYADPMHRRKRDRVTEFNEVLTAQAHIVRKK
eukprot:TRINITY_DN41798_c0_g1_i1.p1 TRINITY_DN41798_c0_g1~~TRINITY_DN41798_c0_g1_i1.p1  ORF type:complete len:212 (-),score=27.99 TRINITY_DN41798_c0_g1_i1:59-694(-)